MTQEELYNLVIHQRDQEKPNNSEIHSLAVKMISKGKMPSTYWDCCRVGLWIIRNSINHSSFSPNIRVRVSTAPGSVLSTLSPYPNIRGKGGMID